MFRPDITVMVDWALKINYLSIPSTQIYTYRPTSQLCYIYIYVPAQLPVSITYIIYVPAHVSITYIRTGHRLNYIYTYRPTSQLITYIYQPTPQYIYIYIYVSCTSVKRSLTAYNIQQLVLKCYVSYRKWFLTTAMHFALKCVGLCVT